MQHCDCGREHLPYKCTVQLQIMLLVQKATGWMNAKAIAEKLTVQKAMNESSTLGQRHASKLKSSWCANRGTLQILLQIMAGPLANMFVLCELAPRSIINWSVAVDTHWSVWKVSISITISAHGPNKRPSHSLALINVIGQYWQPSPKHQHLRPVQSGHLLCC